MDITLIEELLRINNDEIKLLNDLNEEVLKEDISTNGNVINVTKQERFIKSDIKERNYGAIYYAVIGNSRHTIDGQSLTLEEGELLFVNKYTHHKIDKMSKNDGVIKIAIDPAFEEMCILQNDFFTKFLCGVLFLEDVKIKYFRMDISSLVSVKNILENMTFSMMKNEEINDKTNVFYLNLMFEHIKNEYIKIKFSPEEKDVRIIVMVIKYIDENMRDGELKHISDTLLMNQYTLSRKIKKMTGFTFKELLQIKKLDTALYLLNNSDMPITKISDTIGYENTSYFHKIFKEKYNVSPKKYRD